MIRPRGALAARLTLAPLLALGCGPVEPPLDADAGPDAVAPLPDRAPLLMQAGLSLWTHPDGARLELEADGERRLQELSVGFEIAGERWLTSDWPDRTWVVASPRAEGRFTGGAGLPDLIWRLRLEDGRLLSAVELIGGPRRILVDRLLLLVGAPPGGAALPPTPGPWARAPVAPRRPNGQLLSDAHGHLALRSPGAWVDLHPDLTVTLRAPPFSLGPGDQRVGPPVEIILDPWPLPDPGPAPPPALGWRSGAWGSAVDGALLRRQAAALDALLPAELPAAQPPAPILLVEGLWYAGPGDWRPGLSFPGGLAGLRAAALPVRLAWRWPALHAPVDTPLAVNRPAARLPDTPRCAAPGCVNLNPALPAIRDAVTRAATAFADDAAVWLSDLPPQEQIGAEAHAALVAELTALHPQLQLAGERLPHTPRWPGFPADDPCADATPAGAPWPPRCAGWLAGADARRPPRPGGLDAERALAWALLGTLADPLADPLDPGPVRLQGRPPGEARISATLAALSGGPRLLGDDLEALDPTTAALAHDLWRAPQAIGRALEPGATDPPGQWAIGADRAAINWTATPARVELPAGRWRDHWTAETFVGQTLVLPHDARLLVRDPTAAVVGGTGTK